MPGKNPDKMSCITPLPEFLWGQIPVAFLLFSPTKLCPKQRHFASLNTSHSGAHNSLSFSLLVKRERKSQVLISLEFHPIYHHQIPSWRRVGLLEWRVRQYPSLSRSWTKRMRKIIRKLNIIPVSLKGHLGTQRVRELGSEFLLSLQFDTARIKSRLP